MSGTVQSIWSFPSKLLNFGGNVVKSLITGRDEIGIQEGYATVQQWWQAFRSSAQQPGETAEAHKARLEEAKKLQRIDDLYRRAFDAETYHLGKAKQVGYVCAEVVQFFYRGYGKLPVSSGKGVSSAAFICVSTLQKGGHTLSSATLRGLNLTKGQANKAIHAMKKANNIPNNFHGTIMSNGDYLHPHTGEILGNIRHYL